MNYRAARARNAIVAALVLVAAPAAPARAQIVSLTVGLDTGCPYGVPN